MRHRPSLSRSRHGAAALLLACLPGWAAAQDVRADLGETLAYCAGVFSFVAAASGPWKLRMGPDDARQLGMLGVVGARSLLGEDKGNTRLRARHAELRMRLEKIDQGAAAEYLDEESVLCTRVALTSADHLKPLLREQAAARR